MERAPRARGFTVVEVLVALSLFALMVGSMLSITFETYASIGDVEADFSAQTETNLAYDRLAEVLRKSGPSSLAGVDYPRVTAGGNELEFRVLRDLDGNGYAFSATTGEAEWSPDVYRVARDPDGTLRVYRGNVPVWHIARHIQAVSFQTYLQDPALEVS